METKTFYFIGVGTAVVTISCICGFVLWKTVGRTDNIQQIHYDGNSTSIFQNVYLNQQEFTTVTFNVSSNTWFYGK